MAKWRWPSLLPRRAQWAVWTGRWGCTEPSVLSSSPLAWSGHPVDSALWVTHPVCHSWCLQLLSTGLQWPDGPWQVLPTSQPRWLSQLCLKAALAVSNRFCGWSKYLLCQVFPSSSLSLYCVWKDAVKCSLFHIIIFLIPGLPVFSPS